MNFDEFKTQVKRQSDDWLKPHVDEALELVKELLREHKEYYPSAIAKAIQFAGGVAPLLIEKNTRKRSSLSKPTYQDIVTSDALIETIMPWIELVRREVFNSADAPFSNQKEMENWLLQQEKLEPEDPLDHLERHNELVKLFVLVGKCKQQGYQLNCFVESRHLDYINSEGEYRHVNINQKAPNDWQISAMREDYWHYSNLNWLENEIRIMVRGTGFMPLSLLQFVLRDVKPILPRYEIGGQIGSQELPTGVKIQYATIDVRIRARDLSFKELYDAYNKYLGLLRLKRRKALQKEHWEVRQFVLENGGVPTVRGQKVASWKSILNEWNKVHPNRQYKDYRGIQMMYKRIQDRSAMTIR
jgi:hypothetical protein